MKKEIFSLVISFIFLVTIVSGSMLIPSNDNAKENSRAPEKSPVISETESGEWSLERVDFIHYAKPQNPGKPDKGGKGETCYKLMGVEWKSLPVSYVINPSNPQNLSEEFITETVLTSAEIWDSATSVELVNDAYIVNANAGYGVQDFVNVIDFGELNPDIIGVTSVWFMRKGRQIVEFDMRLNTRFAWGDANLDLTLMDLESILTHEMGHAFGLDDIYSTNCNTVTMYGYSDNGETQKRTLEEPDITGLQKIYGI